MNSEEIWKPIKAYEGLYEVSNLGKVRALTFHNNKVLKNKITVLKQRIGKDGRKRITLYKNKKPKTFQVHRLVAQAFIPKLDNLPEVNHKNENPLDNRVENLEWCNRDYNMHYGNIREKQLIGKGYKKINQYDLQGNFIKCWDKTLQITEKLGISKQSISYCCNKRTKTAGGYIWRYVNE